MGTEVPEVLVNPHCEFLLSKTTQGGGGRDEGQEKSRGHKATVSSLGQDFPL